jgi:hypothetical protein
MYMNIDVMAVLHIQIANMNEEKVKVLEAWILHISNVLAMIWLH